MYINKNIDSIYMTIMLIDGNKKYFHITKRNGIDGWFVTAYLYNKDSAMHSQIASRP